ncbi:ABC transporter ATP-binding protein [Agrobacterium vitis]|uniref:ABC transporter ATP-binding protein n=1 Tax=Agrobacterium vitis TaxID=373 RepID=UPI0012E856A4|nr:ABC transporter ATP-binding protein [Agrobacterium vitis]MVA23857.1 dipeptide ABC transporter ATP-binding protein [Agrobacterium vitis]
MNAPVLSVQNLTTSFSRDGVWQKVVRNVSFDISRKETVAVVGESGSGKSVTAMSIMRLLPSATSRVEGEILFDGRSLTQATDDQIRAIRGNEIAMIFQEASLNPVYTVGFQLSEALIRHRRMTKTAARAESILLLEKVRIPAARSRIDEYPHKLSGGMCQRVAIALALACQPKLLIADEPTTALDVTIQAQIIELIKLLQEEEDMSVLFITHDMGVVAEVSDRTVVMYKGEMVEADTTEALFSRAAHPYTRALLASIPHLGSMNGRAQPLQFPLVDHKTGAVTQPAESKASLAEDRNPLLEVADLKVRFDLHGGLFGRVTGRVHAVENVSFDIRPGETLSIVGESGCGKSTTARAIMGLVHPKSGSIRLDSRELLTLGSKEKTRIRNRVQMVFQDPFASLNPRMTIGKALAEPLAVHTGLDPQAIAARVRELLSLVGLSAEMADRFPHQFSGGQRQRICIARALALEPQLIVADEAVSALDVSVKAQVVNLLLELQDRLGLSYLFISHDMAVVERISHRVAVMYLGEIVEIGPRQAVFENPQHPYTRQLMAAVPIPDPSRRAVVRGLSNAELKSPIRPANFIPPARKMIEVGPGHLVQALDGDWIEEGTNLPGLSASRPLSEVVTS